MKFMVLRRADDHAESGALPDSQLLTDWTQYNEDLVNAGVLLAAEGLSASSNGVRVKFSNGQPSVRRGPFHSNETISGFLLLDVASQDEAVEWVKRWPTTDASGNFELEIRPVLAEDDFGGAFTPDERRAQRVMRAKSSAAHATMERERERARGL